MRRVYACAMMVCVALLSALPLVVCQATSAAARDVVYAAIRGFGIVEAEDLLAEELSSSGDRGCRTFKVTAGALQACLKIIQFREDEDEDDHHFQPWRRAHRIADRLSAATRAMGDHRLTPRLIAPKGSCSWVHDETPLVMTEWQDGNSLEALRKDGTLEEDRPSVTSVIPEHGDGFGSMLQDIGALLARVHRVDTEWHGALYKESRTHNSFVDVPDASHAWCYHSRGGQWMSIHGLTLPGEDDGIHGSATYEAAVATIRAWADWGSWGPRHPVARHVVSTHGDFGLHNIIKGSDGRLVVVDLDCACVTQAVYDLSCAFADINRITHGRHHLQFKLAFISGYLKQLGEPVDELSIETLVIDAELARLVFWVWNVHGLTRQQVLDRVQLCQVLAARVRACEKMRSLVKTEGLESDALAATALEVQTQIINQGPWYYANYVETKSDLKGEVMIRPVQEVGKALAVLETDLELVEVNLSDRRQVFVWNGMELYHVSSRHIVANATASIMLSEGPIKGFFKLDRRLAL